MTQKIMESHITLYVSPVEQTYRAKRNIDSRLATFTYPGLLRASVSKGKRAGQMDLALLVDADSNSDVPVEDIAQSIADEILASLSSDHQHIETGSNYLMPA